MKVVESINIFENQLKTYTVSYLPDIKPKAILVLVHGLGEHVRRYDDQIVYFSERGYACLTADLAGHGRTEGQRGVWKDIEDHYLTIDGLMKLAFKTFTGLPILLYGHSMGGNIAAGYTLSRKPDLAGMILTGAAIKTPKDLPKFIVNTMMHAPAWIRNFRISNGLNLSSLCTDRSVIKKYTEDPLVHDRVSLGGGAVILYNASVILDASYVPNHPTLIMHGLDDTITLPIGSSLLANKWGNKVTVHNWPGMMHEIHNESAKIEVWDYMLNWMDKTINNG